ncbi:uncharacterized protein LOC111083293 [Limulus polyphemus]|uniref:Uncharacterized protein LOC111083293 n=1 Tax=Limulus polyphemus TaxID=6850 RepID=A0ABM1RVK9_LIMPO|nr:uncharacterized protein LOC111083293 [Limulus polyphemus]
MVISLDGSVFLILSLLCLLLKQNLVVCGMSPTTDLSPNLISFLENTGYTSPLINRTDENLRSQILRSKRDADFAYFDDDDVLELLQQEDYVSAVLNYIELTHNRSDSQHCARTSLKAHFRYDLSNQSFDRFERQAAAAIKTANILTNLFLKDSGDKEMLYNEEFCYSLVKVNVESDPFIYASGIGFQRGVFRPRGKIPPLLFAPYAFRQDGYIETKDLATAYNVSYDEEDSVGSEWFWQPFLRNFTDLIQRKSNTNLSVASVPLLSGGSDIIVGLSDGRWTSPYLECGGGNKWLISYSAPFFGRQENNINFR